MKTYLHRIEPRELLDEVLQQREAQQGRGGAAGLQDEPVTGDEHTGFAATRRAPLVRRMNGMTPVY